MADKDGLPSIDEFGERLKKARPAAAVEQRLKASERTMLGRAFRVSTEMLVSLALTGALGYGADRLFDTAPVFMLIGLALGMAAGFRTVERSMKEMNAELEKDGEET